MPYTFNCDICGAVVKKNETKFLLGIQEVSETNSPYHQEIKTKELQDYLLKYYEDQYKRILVYEICKECKEIVYYLFNMKQKEKEKILNILERTFAQEEKKKKGWGQK